VWVAVVAFAGAYLGHLFWFWLGRAHGVRLLDRFPRMKRHFGKGIRVFERYGAAAIIITQWLYGLRITCAVIIGISRISIVKFLFYEAVSVIVWATTITALGYFFGAAVERLLGRAAHIEKYALIFMILVAGGVWLWHRWNEKRALGPDA
ncbi:MAG: DedA family protein, partial [Thermoanaerobaculia bacterium]